MSSRLHRLIRIIRIVRRRGFPGVSDLCQTLQVKERTIFNDLKELKEDLGVDIQFDKIQRGYYLATDDTELSFLSLGEETAFLLLAACELMACSGGDALVEPLRQHFDEEIRRSLSESGRPKAQPADIVKSERQRQVFIEKKLFIDLCRACSKKEHIKVSISRPAAAEEQESSPCSSAATTPQPGNAAAKSADTPAQTSYTKAQSESTVLEFIPRFLLCSVNEWKVIYDDGNGAPFKELHLSHIEKWESNGNGNGKD